MATMQTDKDSYGKSIKRLQQSAAPLQEIEVATISAANEQWFKDNNIPYKVQD